MKTQREKIYHITLFDNLNGILSHGCLWSDAKRIEMGMECEIVGLKAIKKSRLEECEVTCHAGTLVGQYVPFYFCPRSVMLYILHMGNHPDIDYRGGQQPILHLQADLQKTIEWANRNDVRWAYSDINARTRYAQFYNDPEQIDEIIDWSAVNATDWSDAKIQEYKQAEFLMYESFPLELVEKIGVYDCQIRDKVIEGLGNISIPVSIERDWYY
jgi:hypothetical protein